MLNVTYLRSSAIKTACITFMLASACSESRNATEFCLDGEFDLGARYQGLHPAAGEWYRTRFCYIIEDGENHIMFRGQGRSNPDMEGEWVVSFLHPETVRIINRESPPDVEFVGKNIADEALRYRRADPIRLLTEIDSHPDWITAKSDDGWYAVQYPGSQSESQLLVIGGRLQEFRTMTDMPLRGRVAIVWRWRWIEDNAPELEIMIEKDIVFKAKGTWRTLSASETGALWRLSDNQDAVELPGDRWPAAIKLEIRQLAAGVHLVSGVRTGFSHLVIETSKGLVIADAPAGWVELQQLPPADLVPDFGISGLSENFVDYLGRQFPDTPIRAVAITHAHDDHAAGARAFAAAGADIYAPHRVAAFLTEALNSPAMPDDRFTEQNARAIVTPVVGRLTLGDGNNEIELIELPGGPHVDAALGIWAKDAEIFFQSDLHVPRSDVDTPREDRATTECWFAAWATANLPPGTIVLNSHSSPHTPVSRLAKYLDSETCRRL